VKRSSVSHFSCSIARSLDIVGEWWTPLILRDIFQGLRRFEEIQSDLGIARNILSDRLSTLVDRGVLERVLYQQGPDRYEYRLTEMGLDFYPVLVALINWGDRWLADETGPPVPLVHRSCQKVIRPTMVCPECGEPLTARDLRPARRSASKRQTETEVETQPPD
jgi:DNA-binding HxlR family transcriptional regulator